MRIFCAAMALVFATAMPGLAQEPHAGAAPPDSAPFAVRPEARKTVDTKFWLLGGALNSAMLLDTKSTFDVTRTCRDCYEANPFVRPFVRRGAATTYVAGEMFDAGIMTIAAKMRGAQRPWMRRTWWVVPAALIAGHAVAYRHNVNLLE